ncbi:Protein kinase domain-containing protein [Psidium guajava]|nr:Protein kinase domain-containing protein [Psidium guajava]
MTRTSAAKQPYLWPSLLRPHCRIATIAQLPPPLFTPFLAPPHRLVLASPPPGLFALGSARRTAAGSGRELPFGQTRT